MNVSNVITMIRKEWIELYKNSLVLFTVLFLPLMLAALPLAMIWLMGGYESDIGVIIEELPGQFAGLCEGLSGTVCNQVFMASQFTVLFMMIPLIIPATIAPYSIVGEKTQRSLEPLLATPISTVELLLGKNLAAVIPAILATWLAYGLYAVGARILINSDDAFARLFGVSALVAVFILGPLLAILSVNLSMMISSRSNDPRAAQQIASLIVLPLVLIFVGQMTGLLIFGPTLTVFILISLIIIDIILTYFAVKVFDRETILTRWA